MIESASAPHDEQAVLRETIAAALSEPNAPTPGKIAEELNITEQAVSGWKRTGKIGKANLAKLAKMMGRQVEHFLRIPPDSPPPPGRVDHPMSESDLQDAPQEFEWEDLVNLAVKGKFQVRVPDDAAAPAVRAGTLCTFDPSVTPRPGDGVIVKDGEGRLHFRRWREAESGEWEAYGSSDAFRTYHSRRHELQRLGVLVAMEQRLG